jgi:ABC-type glycerol-3-phosphate transport system permease component
MGHTKIRKILTYISTGLILLIILFPILFIFVSSFKTFEELIKQGTGFFPKKPTLNNYKSLIFARTPVRNFPLFLFNSLKIAIATSVSCILIASLGGYGLARFRYPGGNTLTQLMLFIYVFPTVLVLIPVYKIYANLRLLDKHFGLVIIYSALAAPFCTWLLASFFKSIPVELEEAASIDGATRTATFLKIIIPLASSGILTIGVYSFVLAWGEYMFATILLSSNDNKTVALGLANLTTEQYIEWGPLLAGSVLIIVPVITFFFPVARNFIKGVMAGAVKQ